MRYRQMATAFAFLLSLTAQAVSGSTDRGIDERAVRPGNVGPNSDLNCKYRQRLQTFPRRRNHPPRSRRVTDQRERALERAVPADHTIPIRLRIPQD